MKQRRRRLPMTRSTSPRRWQKTRRSSSEGEVHGARHGPGARRRAEIQVHLRAVAVEALGSARVLQLALGELPLLLGRGAARLHVDVVLQGEPQALLGGETAARFEVLEVVTLDPLPLLIGVVVAG